MRPLPHVAPPRGYLPAGPGPHLKTSSGHSLPSALPLLLPTFLPPIPWREISDLFLGTQLLREQHRLRLGEPRSQGHVQTYRVVSQAHLCSKTCPGGWTVKIVCFFILACLWDPSASDRKRLGNKDKRMPKHIHCQEIKMTKSPSRCH